MIGKELLLGLFCKTPSQPLRGGKRSDKRKGAFAKAPVDTVRV